MNKRYLALAAGVGAILVGALPNHAFAVTTGPQRYVSPFGVDTGDCSDPSNPCQTISYALAQSNQSGDTINVARGAYQEQVLITKSITILGAGADHTTIYAPATLNLDSRPEPQTYIVGITNDGVNPAPAVTMTGLSVAGPGPAGGGTDCSPNSSSLDKGIEVYGGAALTLKNAAVRNIYDRPTSGCQRGDGISIGSACYTCTADTGSATLSGVIVSAFQKNGVAVRGVGSSLKVTGGQVANNPNPAIASNGIEAVNGALLQVSGTNISGNECNVPSTCGPDVVNQTQSAGVLIVSGLAPKSFVKKATITGNDIGLYTDSTVSVTSVKGDNNRYVGFYVDASAQNAVFSTDTANSTGTTPAEYGFYVLSPSINKFVTDTATGNTNTEGGAVTPYDMYAHVSGHDNNIYSANTCNTAYPSLHYWNCA